MKSFLVNHKLSILIIIVMFVVVLVGFFITKKYLGAEYALGVATVFAVIAGPTAAVSVTRIIDDSRAQKNRRMEIFRTLMRTRRMPLHFEHVGALNLIEVEFATENPVIDAWKAYLSNLSEMLSEQENQRYEMLERRSKLLAKLIHSIASVVKIDIQQLDILEGNYVPQAWEDDDWRQRAAQNLMIELLLGKRAINVRPETERKKNSPYPPPPLPPQI